jgi:Flp pilus assembly pilin Flp
MFWQLHRLGVDETGEVVISYSLIASLVAIAAIVAMIQLGDTIPHLFDLVTNTLIDGIARIGL